MTITVTTPSTQLRNLNHLEGTRMGIYGRIGLMRSPPHLIMLEKRRCPKPSENCHVVDLLSGAVSDEKTLRNPHFLADFGGFVVGLTGFEPATP
ncbi:hypothetical protein [Mycetocola spongiae]|uniref:hypothetical protein n=1 Tax=Mycetocola spongiae TaxID=2859226 RepID=UPI001CF2D55E|nr:hypothetical protein [Mycetocola spongiae]UCR89929.1 hypothetical protein KXZ72_04465 [Mycetocola spongiae]